MERSGWLRWPDLAGAMVDGFVWNNMIEVALAAPRVAGMMAEQLETEDPAT